MQNASILPSSTIQSSAVTNETMNNNVEATNTNREEHDNHELCLDDLLKEDSFEKLIKCPNTAAQHLIPNQGVNEFDDNSTVIPFNNMTINSNYGMTGLANNNNFNMNFPPMLETINEDSIKELLGALR